MIAFYDCPWSVLTYLERGPCYRICKPWLGCIEGNPVLGGGGF